MAVSIIEQVKIQAEVLVPLVKAMQAELGKQRANAIVSGALAKTFRGYGEKFWDSKPGHEDLGAIVGSLFTQYAKDDALNYNIVEQSRDSFKFDVTSCQYAEFFKKLGEPELGFLLVCGADFAVADGFGADVTLTRTQTLMQGSSHCNFRYLRDAAASEE